MLKNANLSHWRVLGLPWLVLGSSCFETLLCTEVTKLIWVYIKKNKLNEGRTIKPDSALKAVFPVASPRESSECVTMIVDGFVIMLSSEFKFVVETRGMKQARVAERG